MKRVLAAKMIVYLFAGLTVLTLQSGALADGVRWDLRPDQANVFFSRDESGNAVRANSPSVLLTADTNRLIAIYGNILMAHSLEPAQELWKVEAQETHTLSWLNEQKWILATGRTHFLILDAMSGSTLYRSAPFERLLVQSIGASKSLVAVERYGASSGALKLHFMTLSDDGSYFEAYEELRLEGTFWLRDLAVDEINGRVYLLASHVENRLIQDAWLKVYDISFAEGSRIINGIAEKEISLELDGGADRIAAFAGKLAIGGDIHSKKLWYYDTSASRSEVASFTGGTSGLYFHRGEDLLLANGREQTYNRRELSDLLIIDLQKHSILQKVKAPAFGPVRLSRSVTSFSVAKNKIALSLVDSADAFSGSESEPIVPAVVVLKFPTEEVAAAPTP
jgi:hypothetical protein